MTKNRDILQLIWGAALTAAGIGVFVLLPRRMEQIRQLRQADPFSFDMLFLWFCFGLLGVLLTGGGLHKIVRFFQQRSGSASDDSGRH